MEPQRWCGLPRLRRCVDWQWRAKSPLRSQVGDCRVHSASGIAQHSQTAAGSTAGNRWSDVPPTAASEGHAHSINLRPVPTCSGKGDLLSVNVLDDGIGAGLSAPTPCSAMRILMQRCDMGAADVTRSRTATAPNTQFQGLVPRSRGPSGSRNASIGPSSPRYRSNSPSRYRRTSRSMLSTTIATCVCVPAEMRPASDRRYLGPNMSPKLRFCTCTRRLNQPSGWRYSPGARSASRAPLCKTVQPCDAGSSSTVSQKGEDRLV